MQVFRLAEFILKNLNEFGINFDSKLLDLVNSFFEVLCFTVASHLFDFFIPGALLTQLPARQYHARSSHLRWPESEERSVQEAYFEEVEGEEEHLLII